MSVSGVNSTINTNPQVQQQKSKSKAKAPLYGVGAGVIASGSIAAVVDYCTNKDYIKWKLDDIKREENFMRSNNSYSLTAITADERKLYENKAKESKQHLEKLNAELNELKKIKPMRILKLVATSPITYILAATGLVVGLCVNHKNKSAKQ